MKNYSDFTLAINEATELPQIKFGGKSWIVDQRLGEFRNAKNPHEVVKIGENEFKSTAERDAFITKYFPKRLTGDSPGSYVTPDDIWLGVHLNTVFVEPKDPSERGKIEAYGVKGLKSTRWRKVFKNGYEMQQWLEKNDAEVEGIRPVEESVVLEASVNKPGFVEQKLHDTLGRHGFTFAKTFPGGKGNATQVAKYTHQDGHEVRLDNGGTQSWTAVTNIGKQTHGYGQDKLAAHINKDFGYYLGEISPPGWKGTTMAMKKHGIKKPWALAWSMKNKGYQSHKRDPRESH